MNRVQNCCTFKVETRDAVETTYSSLRGKLAAYLDHVTDDREVVIVRRRGARDVALIAADELEGVMETAHLVRSPRNARRLADSLQELEKGKGRVVSLEALRQSVSKPPRKR